MTPTWIYRVAQFTCLCALLLIFSGAGLTANGLEPAPPDSIAVSGIFASGGHMMIAVVVAALALLVAGFLTAKGGENRIYGVVLFLLVLIEGGIGTPASNPALRPWVPILHASLAPLLFSALAAATVALSPSWQQGAAQVPDGGWPSLRAMAKITPVLVFVQIFLGAAFRHNAMGVMSHIAGAILTALLILLAGMFVNQQCAEHKPLKTSANVLMTFAFTQVALGMGAISARMMTSTNTTPVVLLTGSHVAIGSLVLGANLVLSMHILRYVTPKT
jgi:heme A synthase